MAALPAWAGRFIGIPYAPGGRTYAGADCWGFIRLVSADQFGVDLPAYEGVYWEPVEDRRAAVAMAREVADFMAREREMTWGQVTPGTERPGDVLLLRANAMPIHVGIVCAPGQMLHCEYGCNSAADEYHGMRWVRRVAGIFRPIVS